MGVKKPKVEHRIPMSISLTKDLKVRVERRLKKLGLNRSEYIRQLCERDLMGAE